jgi:hypothetical protein
MLFLGTTSEEIAMTGDGPGVGVNICFGVVAGLDGEAEV